MTKQSFCTKCGASLGNEQKFCTSCGSIIGENPTASPALTQTTTSSPDFSAEPVVASPTAPTPATANTPPNQPARKGGVAIAALSVIAIAAIVLVVLLSTGAINTGDNTSAQNDTTTQNEPKPAQDDVSPEPDLSTTDSAADSEASSGEDEVSLASTDENTGDSQQEVTADDAGSLSLDNEDDYFRINLCLSNFSEIDSLMNGYRSSRTSSDQVFLFAYAHALLNSTKTVQFGEYWPAAGDGPYYARASFESLEKYANLFLKEPLTTEDIPFDACYEDGYVYTNLETMLPEGIAIATSMEYLGNEQYQIGFEIYRNAWDESYTVTDESYYRMTPQELAQAFDQRFPSCVGTAVLEAGYDDEAAPFKLLSYDSTPA